MGTYFGLDHTFSRTLHEWYRVLKNGGIVLISVPDLATLAQQFLRKDLIIMEKIKLMHMMYGGQTDANDVHHIGLDEDILTLALASSGFCEIERLDRFGLFYDTSELLFKNIPISLNMKAVACKDLLDTEINTDIDEE